LHKFVPLKYFKIWGGADPGDCCEQSEGYYLHEVSPRLNSNSNNNKSFLYVLESKIVT